MKPGDKIYVPKGQHTAYDGCEGEIISIEGDEAKILFSYGSEGILNLKYLKKL